MARATQPDAMMTVVLAAAFAVVVGNIAMLILLFIENPDDQEKWR